MKATTTIDPKEFAAAWGVSDRAMERYVARGGIPHVKERGRVRLTMPAAAHWMQRRVLANSIHRRNPKLAGSEVQRQANAVWLGLQDTDYDPSLDAGQ